MPKRKLLGISEIGELPWELLQRTGKLENSATTVYFEVEVFFRSCFKGIDRVNIRSLRFLI